MLRKTNPAAFRARFEPLESRVMMAADLSVYSAATFLASNLQPQVDDLGLVSGYVLQASSAGVIPSASMTVRAPAPTMTPTHAVSSSTSSSNLTWCNANITDSALRSLVYQDVSDNVINRGEMLGIFTQVGKDGSVSSNEFADLKRLVGKTSFFTGIEYVGVLATDIVAGNVANAHYQGTTLGNLVAGSSASQLNKLVHKWFLGDDHPLVAAGLTYRQSTGTLFPKTASYTDVRQGMLGDCYFLASLGEAAQVNPVLVTSMFIVNGDGTYTVRFYNNKRADYVTVDSMLPVDSRGYFYYDNLGFNISNKTVPLWVALAEKAYAQMNESGWLRASLGDKGGNNNYDALSGGYMFEALAQITGQTGAYTYVDSAPFLSAFNAGKLITFGSFGRPADSSVVGGHAYAVVGYNKSAGTVTLFNPWGINNGYAPGLVTLTWAQMKRDFASMQFTT